MFLQLEEDHQPNRRLIGDDILDPDQEKGDQGGLHARGPGHMRGEDHITNLTEDPCPGRELDNIPGSIIMTLELVQDQESAPNTSRHALLQNNTFMAD